MIADNHCLGKSIKHWALYSSLSAPSDVRHDFLQVHNLQVLRLPDVAVLPWCCLAQSHCPACQYYRVLVSIHAARYVGMRGRRGVEMRKSCMIHHELLQHLAGRNHLVLSNPSSLQMRGGEAQCHDGGSACQPGSHSKSVATGRGRKQVRDHGGAQGQGLRQAAAKVRPDRR